MKPDTSKPLDIERLRADGKGMTVDGRVVTIYTTEAPGSFPIHGRIGNNYFPQSWRIDGLCDNPDSQLDLFNLPPKPREWWIVAGRYLKKTKEEAWAESCSSDDIIHVREVLENEE